MPDVAQDSQIRVRANFPALLKAPVTLLDNNGGRVRRLGLALACPNVSRPLHPLFDPDDPDGENDLYTNDWLSRLIYVSDQTFADHQDIVTKIAEGLFLARGILDEVQALGCQGAGPSRGDDIVELLLDAGVSFRPFGDPGDKYVILTKLADETTIPPDLRSPTVDTPIPMQGLEYLLLPHAARELLRSELCGIYKNTLMYSFLNEQKATGRRKRSSTEVHLGKFGSRANVFTRRTEEEIRNLCSGGGGAVQSKQSS